MSGASERFPDLLPRPLAEPLLEPLAEPLLELLGRRALAEPDRIAFSDEGEEHWSWGRLWAGIEGFAAGLRARGLGSGDRVVLALPNGEAFFVAFYGTLRARGVAVPLYPDSGPERLLDFARSSRARGLVVGEDLEAERRRSLEEGAAGEGRWVSAVGEVSAGEVLAGLISGESPAREPESVAFLQVTSGSTGEPRAVEITHRGLVVNIRQLIDGMAITGADRFVSWLPVCHDMGLILMTMVPFVLGLPLHLLPTRLRVPGHWIRALARHRGTFTAAPDFAWRLMLRTVRDAGRLDLTSLRVALDAAEPVRLGTAARFLRAFGLADGVMTAGYGLAEATVGVAMSPPGRPLVADERGFVSVGRPFPGIEVAIESGGERLGAGVIGEILVRTPAACRGYFDAPRATARLFTRDGYLRTGDLGYLDAAGELRIVGRTKNLILCGGRNLAPREIEEVVDALPFVGGSAAVGVDLGGPEGEQLHLFVELRTREVAHRERFAERVIRIVQAINDHLGLRPARVLLLRPRAIPRTKNGKMRHARVREKAREGWGRALLYPEAACAPSG